MERHRMAKSPAKPANFDKATRAKLRKLIAHKSSDLAWHYAVGQLVEELAPQGENNFGKMKALVELIDGKGKRVPTDALNAARDFSRSVPKEELGTLEGLSFAHVGKLLTIKGKKRRDWYREQCQAKKWPFRKLDAMIKEEFGKKSRGGRPFVEVKGIGPTVALNNVLWLRDAWQKKFAPALEQNLEPLAKKLRGKSAEKYSEQVDETCTALDELCAAAQDAREKLGTLKKIRKARG